MVNVYSGDTMLILKALHYNIKLFTHLKLCLAPATHNFKWVKINHICVYRD